MPRPTSYRLFTRVTREVTAGSENDNMFVDCTEEEFERQFSGKSKEEVLEYQRALSEFVNTNKPLLSTREMVLDGLRPMIMEKKRSVQAQPLAQLFSLLAGGEANFDDLPLVEAFEKADEQSGTIRNRIKVAEKKMAFVKTLLEKIEEDGLSEAETPKKNCILS